MTQDTFVRLVRGIAESYGPLQGSTISKITAVAREHGDPLDVPEAMKELRVIFGRTIDRQGYAAIEQKLSRY
ncbi:MAG: hypothetical protein WAW00_00770 [Candidatus Moraniibacteriota bacterium]